METTYSLKNGKRIRLLEGDITRVAVDAIANAANSRLAGGGGVDGAIHRAGGPEIMRELDTIRARIGSLNPGDAVSTTAGRLPAKFVFHTVGPIYGGRAEDPATLASCYRRCLELAAAHGARSVSFPAISTGVYGYPSDAASVVAIQTVLHALSAAACPVDEVVFVQFGQAQFDVYAKELARQLSGA